MRGGNGIIQLTNNTGDLLTITKVESDSSRNNYNESVVPGEKVTLYMNRNYDCECDGTETKKECTYEVFSTSRYGIETKEIYTITIDCVVDIGTSVPPVKPLHCADYDKDWVIGVQEINRILSYWREGAYHVNPIGYDGYAGGVGIHDGPYHCSDLDKDWNISVTEKDKAFELWMCPLERYDYYFTIED